MSPFVLFDPTLIELSFAVRFPNMLASRFSPVGEPPYNSRAIDYPSPGYSNSRYASCTIVQKIRKYPNFSPGLEEFKTKSVKINAPAKQEYCIIAMAVIPIDKWL